MTMTMTGAGLPVRILFFFLIYALVPLAAIGLGLAMFFLGRRYVRSKYGKRG